ncbi:MAG: YCF48-related protein [Acetobacteraceae bacterium]
MAGQANVYASVAGTVGRSDKDKGAVGVFRRPAETGVWEHVLSEHNSNTVFVHPTDPNVVLAGTHDGVYRSTDRGKTFTRTNFPDKGMEIWSFLADAGDPKLVYAGGSPLAVYRSEDSGETWRRLPDPVMPARCVMPFGLRVMRMAQHPSKPGTIFAALEVGGVMRTTDGGESWKDCSDDLIRLAKQPHLKSKIASDTSDEGMLDGHAIAISAADPDAVIVAVRMGLFRTADDGNTWQDMEVGRFSPTTYGRDIHVSPTDPATLYSALSVAAASKDGAVYRSQDAGKTWSRFDKVQVHGTIMSVALHRNDPNQVYIGARYEGEVFGTLDGGNTWQPLPLPRGVKDIYALACG